MNQSKPPAPVGETAAHIGARVRAHPQLLPDIVAGQQIRFYGGGSLTNLSCEKDHCSPCAGTVAPKDHCASALAIPTRLRRPLDSRIGPAA